MTWHFAQLLLAAYGLSWILGRSKITLGVRQWLDRADSEGLSPAGWMLALLECPACTGWWLGIAYGIRIGANPGLIALTVLTTNLILETITSHLKE